MTLGHEGSKVPPFKVGNYHGGTTFWSVSLYDYPFRYLHILLPTFVVLDL